MITIVDLEGGLRDVFPEGLAHDAALAGKEAILTLSGGSPAHAADGEPADDQVRLCVRRLQGTRTLLRKKFRVSSGSLLFTVFTRACERLRIKESGVIFVHDGVILSGRQKAGTLLAAGRRVVQVFAVCKRAWACKQRAAARRGLVSAGHSVARLLPVQGPGCLKPFFVGGGYIRDARCFCSHRSSKKCSQDTHLCASPQAQMRTEK